MTDQRLGLSLGLEIVESSLLIEHRQHSRSPARAKRRAKLGHRQCYKEFPLMKGYQVGNKLIMHPALAASLREELRRRVERSS